MKEKVVTPLSQPAGKNGQEAAPVPAAPPAAARRSRAPAKVEMKQGLVEAYRETHQGFSMDHLLADPELNAAFLDACRRRGLEGDAIQWNRLLMQTRKSGQLPRLQTERHPLTVAEMDAYSFASEIALERLSRECDVTVDDILCDPSLAARFDRVAEQFAPGHSSFQYRWAALGIRKKAKKAKKAAVEHAAQWQGERLSRAKALAGGEWAEFSRPGVYVVLDDKRKALYVGETLNLRQRIEPLARLKAWKELGVAQVRIGPDVPHRAGLQSFLIHREKPSLNSRLLDPDDLP